MYTAYHPQTDGQTEATNRMVEMILRCILHESQEAHWERNLSMVEFVINNSPSQSIGYSPFYLNYGYHPITPVELLRDVETTAVEGVTTFVQRLQSVFGKAVQYLHRAQERQKIQSDRRRREQVFQPGEQVLLSTEHLQLKNAPVRKLRTRFVGPFFVIRRIGKVAYELELPQTWKIHNVFHTSLLRPFKTSSWTVPIELTAENLELEDTTSYEIEKLLRWRWSGPSGRRQREFLILWADYPIDDASWIPESNFDHPEEIQSMIERDSPWRTRDIED